MKIYIKSAGIISPQLTFDVANFPSSVCEVISDRLFCIEPEYRDYINPIRLRRMPRIIKMGLAASQICINRAGNIQPDGIIVGTGLGCLDNLEKFLLEVIDNDEYVKSVLAFVNSTHNAVASQIAMLHKNHNYNITYCHRGLSFESALSDALMQFEDMNITNILVGGIDECTDDFMKIQSYMVKWKNPLNNLQLLNEHTPGTIAGEGSAFFMLSSQPSGKSHNIILKDVHTFFLSDPNEYTSEVQKEINYILQRSGLASEDVDAVLMGWNGDQNNDGIYYSLQNNFFSEQSNMLFYKHLCGEYYTSASFALWLAGIILENQEIPDVCLVRRSKQKPLRNVLIYNQFDNSEHSLILLTYE